MLSTLTQTIVFYNNNEPHLIILLILTSTLAAGIVQDTFAGEGEGGEEETTGGYFYCYFTAQARNRFLTLEFLSRKKTNTRMRIRKGRTYTYIPRRLGGVGLASLEYAHYNSFQGINTYYSYLVVQNNLDSKYTLLISSLV